MDASLDKLESDAELERAKELLSRNIIRHTPQANTPGATLSLSSSHKLYEEVY